jgi:hypothetical protein
MLVTAAISVSAAYVLIVRSTRRGDLSVVAPFRYSALLFAAVTGYLVWGDVPNALAWCGIALLVGSGIYVLRADRRARARPARRRSIEHGGNRVRQSRAVAATPARFRCWLRSTSADPRQPLDGHRHPCRAMALMVFANVALRFLDQRIHPVGSRESVALPG